MSQRIDIVNIALGLLASRPLTAVDLSDGTSDRAIIINANYPIARDSTLEEHDWSFAIKRFTPAKDTASPDFGPANRFRIPSDILRVLSVDYDATKFAISRSASADMRDQAEWVAESGFILTRSEKIYCRGIRRVEDEGIFSGLFAHAFAAKLALLTCYAVTKSNSRFKDIAAIYAGVIDDAKTQDGLQGRNRRITAPNLLRARAFAGRGL